MLFWATEIEAEEARQESESTGIGDGDKAGPEGQGEGRAHEAPACLKAEASCSLFGSIKRATIRPSAL